MRTRIIPIIALLAGGALGLQIAAGQGLSLGGGGFGGGGFSGGGFSGGGLSVGGGGSMRGSVVGGFGGAMPVLPPSGGGGFGRPGLSTPSLPGYGGVRPMPPGGGRPGRPGGGGEVLPWPPPDIAPPTPILPPGGHFPRPPEPPTPELPIAPPVIGGGDWCNGTWGWWWGRRRWLRSRWFRRSGYFQYMNPYVDVVVKKPKPPEPGTREAHNQAVRLFEAARQRFLKRDYGKAYREIRQALELKPGDRTLLEFQALVAFSLRKYKEAAADLHTVLATGPGWDWPTLIGLYGNVKSYTRHLRQLEEYAKKNPRNPEARLVLAYHYVTGKHMASAITTLEELIDLTPGDALPRELLEAAKEGPKKEGEEEPEGDTPALPESFDYRGVWTAESPDGGTITLDLKPEAEFTWKYAGEDESYEFKGEFAIDRSRILFEEASQGPLFGSMISKGDDAFVFRVENAPKKDPGLTFRRR